jgi:hypothetical protein
MSNTFDGNQHQSLRGGFLNNRSQEKFQPHSSANFDSNRQRPNSPQHHPSHPNNLYIQGHDRSKLFGRLNPENSGLHTSQNQHQNYHSPEKTLKNSQLQNSSYFSNLGNHSPPKHIEMDRFGN